jgi:hypothetical protein
LALFSLVTLLAVRLSQGGRLSAPVTAWYHKPELIFADCLALCVDISGMPGIS